jgi:hypothetical protein
MAFHSSQDNTKTQSAARAAAARILAHTMDATPTPAASASPTTTPSPTPTPIPTPSGLPQVPTRVGFAEGATLGTGTTMLAEVMETDGVTPHQETATPQVWTSDTNNIGICQDPTTKAWCVYPYTQVNPGAAGGQFQYAWDIGFNINVAAPPEHLQLAVVFPDSTGVSNLYRFDGFRLTCAQPALQFVGGAAVIGTPADIGLDCQNNQLAVPSGFQDMGAAQADEFGAFIQDLHDVSNVGNFTSAGTTIQAPMVATLLDHVVVVKDAAGIYHKVMIFYLASDGNGNITEIDGADLAADATGKFSF